MTNGEVLKTGGIIRLLKPSRKKPSASYNSMNNTKSTEIGQVIYYFIRQIHYSLNACNGFRLFIVDIMLVNDFRKIAQ